MGENGIPISVGIIIGAAILGAMTIAGMILMAIIGGAIG